MLLNPVLKQSQTKRNFLESPKIGCIFLLFFILISASEAQAQTKETNPEYLKKHYGPWKTYESKHFKFFYRNSGKLFARKLEQKDLKEIARAQESNIKRVASILNIAENQIDKLDPIKVWLFCNSKTKTEITKIHSDAFEIHPFCSIYYTYKSAKSAHETGHLVINEFWGHLRSKKYNFLIAEGFASLVDEGYGERNFDYYKKAKYILSKDKYSMEVIIQNKPITGFFKNPYTQKAIVAGAFVKYLIEKYDIGKFKRLWQKLRNDSKIFKKVYNKSLDDLCLDFKSYIND